jgi:hypothetical protein
MREEQHSSIMLVGGITIQSSKPCLRGYSLNRCICYATALLAVMCSLTTYSTTCDYSIFTCCRELLSLLNIARILLVLAANFG